MQGSNLSMPTLPRCVLTNLPCVQQNLGPQLFLGLRAKEYFVLRLPGVTQNLVLIQDEVISLYALSPSIQFNGE